MIGNDIVDLKALPSEPRYQRKGYLEKICVDSEIEQILKAPEPELMLWKTWAMKEAAWKANFFFDRKRKFNPKKFICNYEKASVKTADVSYFCQLTISNKYIHAIAIHESQEKVFDYRILENQNAKENLRLKIANELQITPELLSFKKIDKQIPALFKGSVQLPYRFSISHDGQFEAWAILSNNT